MSGTAGPTSGPIPADTDQEPGSKMTGSTEFGLFAPRKTMTAAVCVVAALALAGCGGKKNDVSGALAPSHVTTIGVNSYLWRAALDAEAVDLGRKGHDDTYGRGLVCGGCTGR